MPASGKRLALRTPGTTRIVLHGALRKEFGGPFDWGCNTPAAAIYALTVNKPGFRQAMERGSFRVVRGARKDGIDLDENMLRLRFGELPELHIIPAAAGAKSSGGLIKIVLGVVLVAASVATAGGALAGIGGVAGVAGGAGIGGISFAGSSLFGISAGALGLFGGGLLLGGIGDILTTQPKPPRPNASFLLSGPLNTTAAGGPVPLAYGVKIRVGSTVISSSYEATALGASSNADYGGTPGSTSGGSYDPPVQTFSI